mgnify:CR=1 FL=1
MKTLELNHMEVLVGGRRGSSGGAKAVNCDHVKAAGIITCVGTAFWPIGTIIFGPSCGGLLIGAAKHC